MNHDTATPTSTMSPRDADLPSSRLRSCDEYEHLAEAIARMGVSLTNLQSAIGMRHSSAVRIGHRVGGGTHAVLKANGRARSATLKHLRGLTRYAYIRGIADMRFDADKSAREASK